VGKPDIGVIEKSPSGTFSIFYFLFFIFYFLFFYFFIFLFFYLYGTPESIE